MIDSVQRRIETAARRIAVEFDWPTLEQDLVCHGEIDDLLALKAAGGCSVRKRLGIEIRYSVAQGKIRRVARGWYVAVPLAIPSPAVPTAPERNGP